MATLRDAVIDALGEIGVLQAGEDPSYADAQLSFRAANRLLDQWSLQRLAFFINTRTLWTIVSGTQSYTVGTGFTVNAARPSFINQLSYLDTSVTPNLELPLEILTEEQYASIPLKTLQGTQPVAAYYNPTMPTGLISLYPVPTSSTLQGVMYAPTRINAFANLTDALTFPPGYESMLVKNLALELAPTFSRTPSQELKEQAREAIALVKRVNSKALDLFFPADALINGHGNWSIYTGP